MSERLDCSPFSQDEIISGSIACLNKYTNKKQRKNIESSKEIETFSEEIAANKIFESLANQNMLKTNIEFAEVIYQKANAFVKNDSFENWRFYIDGFNHTGKTTILGQIAKSCISHLSHKKEMKKVFFFPINWEKTIQKVSDINSLYSEIVVNSLQMITWQFAQIFPISNFLTNWFMTLPYTKTSPPLPPSIKGCPLFPVVKIESLGSQICTSFKNGPENVSLLLRMICSIPSILASIFGFEKTMVIYDHIDLCNFPFSMENEEFNSSGDLLEALMQTLPNSLCIVSTKKNGVSMDQMGAPLTFVDTSNFLTNDVSDGMPAIQLSSPSITFSASMCVGCPQVLHKYSELLKAIEIRDQMKDANLAKYGIVATGAKFQEKIIRERVLQFCDDVLNIGAENVTEEIIDQIRASEKLEIEMKK